MKNDIIIPVEIGGVTFKNPFYVASGPTTKSVQQLMRIEKTGWGAASIKLTIDPAPYVNRKPRYAVFDDRDALCFTAEKRLEFEQGLRLVEDSKKLLTDLKLLANITYAGDTGYHGWVNMAKKFEEAGADIIELNMCCPNMSYNMELTEGDKCACDVKTGASLGQQGDVVSQIVREIKKEINIPLFVKLTGEGGQIAQVSKTIVKAGADAVGGAANRLGIPKIDLENPSKAVYHLQEEISMSCYCGSWLKPLAQRDTYEMRKAIGSEPRIMATGGITNEKDAVEMIMCGADLIGICSETLIRGFDIVRPMISGLKSWMDEHKYTDIKDFRDAIVTKVKTAPELTIYGGYARIKDKNLSAPCKDACPHHVSAQAYVRKVAKGDIKKAYKLITGKGPLQQTCGYICSRPCEDACTRGENGEPVRIRDIKRFVLEYGKEQGWKSNVKMNSDNGKKVAVIGSGPAGISNAYYMRKAGYDVTIFEKDKLPGGMLRYVIPSFKIAKNVVDDEIEKLTNIGVKIETNKKLGKDITINSLKEDGFEVVFLGIGAQKGVKLNIPNEDAEGVIDAIDFLKDVKQGKEVNTGKTVVVVGKEYAALDAARAAKRLGAKNVYVTFSGTKEDIAISIDEIEDAEAEGINIMYLTAPVEIESIEGKLTGIKMCNQVVVEGNNSQTRRIEPMKSTGFSLECDTVIKAIGQYAQTIDGIEYDNGLIKTKQNIHEVIEDVFAGGDAVEPKTIIEAVAAGHNAAVEMDKHLQGDDAFLEYDRLGGVASKEAVLKRTGYYKDEELKSLEIADGNQRIKNFETYTRTMTKEEAIAEASRCLACGCGEGCEVCKTICSEFAVKLESEDTIKINPETCVACGMCFNQCPNQNIEMVSTGKKV